VGSRDFTTYHRIHVWRSTWVALVPTAVELATATGPDFRPPPGVGRSLSWLVLMAATPRWSSTAKVRVAILERLTFGADPSRGEKLVRTNMFRTAG
jgi:hypothetical protein